jgi:hypothetical protein
VCICVRMKIQASRYCLHDTIAFFHLTRMTSKVLQLSGQESNVPARETGTLRFQCNLTKDLAWLDEIALLYQREWDNAIYTIAAPKRHQGMLYGENLEVTKYDKIWVTAVRQIVKVTKERASGREWSPIQDESVENGYICRMLQMLSTNTNQTWPACLHDIMQECPGRWTERSTVVGCRIPEEYQLYEDSPSRVRWGHLSKMLIRFSCVPFSV